MPDAYAALRPLRAPACDSKGEGKPTPRRASLGAPLQILTRQRLARDIQQP